MSRDQRLTAIRKNQETRTRISPGADLAPGRSYRQRNESQKLTEAFTGENMCPKGSGFGKRFKRLAAKAADTIHERQSACLHMPWLPRASSRPRPRRN
jgi:hypothetical protein